VSQRSYTPGHTGPLHHQSSRRNNLSRHSIRLQKRLDSKAAKTSRGCRFTHETFPHDAEIRAAGDAFLEIRNLTGDGFSWAPSTFLSRRGTSITNALPDPSREYRQALTMRDIASPNETYVDSKGFHVRFPGISLELTEYTRQEAKELQIHVEDLDSRHCSWRVTNSKFPELTWDLFAGLTSPTMILPR
jgi:hypothetical protein